MCVCFYAAYLERKVRPRRRILHCISRSIHFNSSSPFTAPFYITEFFIRAFTTGPRVPPGVHVLCRWLIPFELCFRFFVCFAHYDHRPHVSGYARVLRRWYVIIELGFYFFVFSDAFRLSDSTIVSTRGGSRPPRLFWLRRTAVR